VGAKKCYRSAWSSQPGTSTRCGGSHLSVAGRTLIGLTWLTLREFLANLDDWTQSIPI